ncbi:pyocin knob domain-containing protein [uncultured Draconibacterium sp.]|uniref:pyocin knob domain-containing protein n=1 Tax=uncultured Draconibacterium sp. TaxID=1573823 RepID=UPI0029C76ADC|nr:pyocin knob domain-containing protein [uncultured Draconibacterium sp.]
MKRILIILLLLVPVFTFAQQSWERIKPISAQVELLTPDTADLLLVEDITDGQRKSLKILNLPLSQAAQDSIEALWAVINGLSASSHPEATLTSDDTDVFSLNQETQTFTFTAGNLNINKSQIVDFGDYLQRTGGTMLNTNLVGNMNAEYLGGISSGRVIYGDNSYGTIRWNTSVDSIGKSGFYFTDGGVQGNPTTENYNIIHSAYNVSDDRYAFQIASRYNGSNFYMRTGTSTANVWNDWVELWHSGNLTALSGLTNDLNVSDFPNDAGYLTGYTETDPTVNNETITIQRNGSIIGSFTLNQGANETFNIIDENTTYTSSDFDHDQLINAHNLTTDIDHDKLTNFLVSEHFTQAEININQSQVSNLISDLSLKAERQINISWETGIINNSVGFNSSAGEVPTSGTHFGFFATLDGNDDYGGAFVMRNDNAFFQTREGGVLQGWRELWHTGNFDPNDKQDNITLTTTGNSGTSTFSGNILNVPNYTLAGLGYSVPSLQDITSIGSSTSDLIYANGHIASDIIYDISGGIYLRSTGTQTVISGEGASGSIILRPQGNAVLSYQAQYNSSGNFVMGDLILYNSGEVYQSSSLGNGLDYSATVNDIESGDIDAVFSSALIGVYPVWHSGNLTALSGLTNDLNVSDFPNDAGYLTGYTETDPAWAAFKNRVIYGDNSYGTIRENTSVDDIVKSGFYFTGSGVTGNPTTHNYNLIHSSYNGGARLSYQIAARYNANEFYMRTATSTDGVWNSWNELWHSGNLDLWNDTEDLLLNTAEVTIEAYNATTWNGSAKVVTQDAIRDKIETFGSIATKGFWTGTQAAYDALGSYDSNTIYFIED